MPLGVPRLELPLLLMLPLLLVLEDWLLLLLLLLLLVIEEDDVGGDAYSNESAKDIMEICDCECGWL